MFCLKQIKRSFMSDSDQVEEISRLLELQSKAIRAKDVAGATKNYSPGVIVFDVVGPLAHPGGDASVKKRLEQWFSTFKADAEIFFEQIDLVITADETLAFSHAFNHVQAILAGGGSLDMHWRETLNWRKTSGLWKIVHTHSSVPFDPTTGLALTKLKP
jgi:ketosteroid isomerase-like protein